MQTNTPNLLFFHSLCMIFILQQNNAIAYYTKWRTFVDKTWHSLLFIDKI